MNGERVGAAQLRALELRLTPRDWAILRSLEQHRFLLTSQLQRLHFFEHASDLAGIRASVRVLDRLRRLRLITRLARRIGGVDAGSRGFVWCLDSVGDRLVHHGDEGRPIRQRFFEPTILFLEHTLASAELRVRLEEAARSGRIELLGIETESGCWRDYVGPHGQPAVLKPDLALITATSAYEDHWFVEVDRGTESSRTVLAKCAQYEAYRRTGREQATHGVFPLVVWSVLDERRRARLEDAIQSARELDSALYRVAVADDTVRLLTGEPPPDDATIPARTTSTLERRNP